MIDLARVPTTDAELAAKYAARKAELHRQLDLIAARHRPNLAVNPMAGVPVTIPPTILPALRRPAVDRASLFWLELPDGRRVVATGGELVKVAEDLVRLNGALSWGGEPTIRRFLGRLQGRRPGPWRH